MIIDDGYALTYCGYDYLALKVNCNASYSDQVFFNRGYIREIKSKVGVGKESDIYLCENEENEPIIIKFTRLGRTSFKTIKKNRDYIQHRTSFNWLYLSRLSALKEFAFMKALYTVKVS
jgi:RIO kinase 2